MLALVLAGPRTTTSLAFHFTGSSMNRFAASVCFILLSTVFIGCSGSSEPTVIEPTETYELTAQEQGNRDQEAKLRAEEKQE